MKRWRFLFLSFASCTLHPPYERPFIESPDAWRTPLNTANGVDIGWWKQLGDESLDHLVQEALLNNQDLQVAVARVDQYTANLGIARSKLYPQINANGFANRQEVSPSITLLPPGGPRIFNTFGLLSNISYLVDLWGEVRSFAEAAYHEWLGSIEARRIAVVAIVSSTASAYIQMRQFDQQLFISEQTLKERQNAYELAKIRFELGLTSQLPVEQAISEVETAKIEVERLQIAIAEMENLLSFLIGKPSMTIPRGLLLDQIPMPPGIPSYLPVDLLSQRPDIRAAEEKLIAANANIGVAKAKFFPQFFLNGNLGGENVQIGKLIQSSSRVWEYGSTIFQEIFTGGRLTSNVNLTEAKQREALHQYLSTVLNGFKEANDAFISHKIDLEQVEIEKLRVESLQRYLYLSNLRYQEGQIDYLTFLDAERQLFRAELDYEQTKGNSFLSLIQIYQALGGGWVLEADATLNSSYTAPAHLE